MADLLDKAAPHHRRSAIDMACAAGIPLRSDMSLRDLWDIPRDEQYVEIQETLDNMRKQTPALIAAKRISPEECQHRINCWLALAEDYEWCERTRQTGHTNIPRTYAAIRWQDKLCELQREIVIRRRTWPGMANDPTRNLQPDIACLRMERIEALHNWFWSLMPWFDEREANLPTRRQLSDTIYKARYENWLAEHNSIHSSGTPDAGTRRA